MFIFGHLFISLAGLINIILTVFYFVLVIRIILSWVNPDPYNEIVRVVYKITDVILNPIRRYLPIRVGMIDFSPIVAFLLVYFLKYFLVSVLLGIGQRLL